MVRPGYPTHNYKILHCKPVKFFALDGIHIYHVQNDPQFEYVCRKFYGEKPGASPGEQQIFRQFRASFKNSINQYRSNMIDMFHIDNLALNKHHAAILRMEAFDAINGLGVGPRQYYANRYWGNRNRTRGNRNNFACISLSFHGFLNNGTIGKGVSPNNYYTTLSWPNLDAVACISHPLPLADILNDPADQCDNEIVAIDPNQNQKSRGRASHREAYIEVPPLKPNNPPTQTDCLLSGGYLVVLLFGFTWSIVEFLRKDKKKEKQSPNCSYFQLPTKGGDHLV